MLLLFGTSFSVGTLPSLEGNVACDGVTLLPDIRRDRKASHPSVCWLHWNFRLDRYNPHNLSLRTDGAFGETDSRLPWATLSEPGMRSCFHSRLTHEAGATRSGIYISLNWVCGRVRDLRQDGYELVEHRWSWSAVRWLFGSFGSGSIPEIDHYSLTDALSAMMAVFIWLMVMFCATMECRKEQRSTIKSCAVWGFDAARTIRSIRAAFGDHALSHTQIRHWLRVFQADPTRPVSDGKRCGRPVSKRTETKVREVEEVVMDDRHKTIRQISAASGMSHTSALKVVRKDLKMHKIAAKFVPHKLTGAHQRARLNLAQTHLQMIQNDPNVLNRIVATDKSWIFTYDPRNKMSDMQWVTRDDPRPTKCLRARSERKVMLTLFFDSNGIISMDFLENGTVDSEVYIDSLRRMREAYRRKRPHYWEGRQFFLLQDNASPHRSTPTTEYLQSVNQALWSHLAYSPDLSPCDFWIFPLIKAEMKGHRFQNIADLETAARRALQRIPKVEFTKYFNDLATRYQKCVDAGGSYFETRGRRPISREPENWLGTEAHPLNCASPLMCVIRTFDEFFHEVIAAGSLVHFDIIKCWS